MSIHSYSLNCHCKNFLDFQVTCKGSGFSYEIIEGIKIKPWSLSSLKVWKNSADNLRKKKPGIEKSPRWSLMNRGGKV